MKKHSTTKMAKNGHKSSFVAQKPLQTRQLRSISLKNSPRLKLNEKSSFSTKQFSSTPTKIQSLLNQNSISSTSISSTSQQSQFTSLFNNPSPLKISTRTFAINLTSISPGFKPAPSVEASLSVEPISTPSTPSPPPPLSSPSIKPSPTKISKLKSPLTITPSAQQRVIDICNSQDPPAKGIRLGVRTRGCSGLTYTLNFTDGPLSKMEERVMIPSTDIQLFIDNKALLYIIGTTMDWAETDVSTEFTFTNPNSKGSCGCGESFTV